MRQNLITIILLVVLCACRENREKMASNAYSLPRLPTSQVPDAGVVPQGELMPERYLGINCERSSLLLSTAPSHLTIRSITLISLDKSMDTIDNAENPAYNQYFKKYSKWRLSDDQIVEVMIKSKPISSEKWNYDFLVLRCAYSGIVVVNQELVAGYWINAGSFINLHFKDTTLIYGYYGPKEYFIEKAATWE
jgi:hypothetical protein